MQCPWLLNNKYDDHRRLALRWLGMLSVAAPISMLPACSERRIVFVGDRAHYFQVEHERVLRSLGSSFFSNNFCVEEKRPIVFENPSTLRSVIDALVANPPELIAVIGDDEALEMRKRLPNTPTVFYVDHDPVSAGLVRSIDRPGATTTGVANDVPAFVKPVQFVRDLFPVARALRVAIAARPEWYSDTRRNAWEDAAKAVDIKLLFIPAPNYDSLLRNSDWQRPDKFDAWIVPFGKAQITNMADIAARLNSHRTIGLFERFNAVSLGAAFGYEDTSYNWYAPFALAIRLLASGVPADSVPVRTPDAWKFAANLATLRRLNVEVPITVSVQLGRVF